jgi:hypothetical protein
MITAFFPACSSLSVVKKKQKNTTDAEEQEGT